MMYQKLVAIIAIPDFRRKLLLTVALLVVVYRMSFWIPQPIVNQERMLENLEKIQ